MVEKDKDVEDDTVEIEAHESEYILSESSADALGQEFLDAVNAAFKEDSDQEPLWTLIHHTELLPKSDPSKPRPAMSGKDGPGLELPPETLAALGEKFLGVLEHFIREVRSFIEHRQVGRDIRAIRQHEVAAAHFPMSFRWFRWSVHPSWFAMTANSSR